MSPLALSLRSVAAPSFTTGRRWAYPLCALWLVLMQGMPGMGDGAVASAIAAMMILLIGIPHGALDIEIAAQRFGRATRADRQAIIAAYLAAATAMAALWWLMPPIALALFLIVSMVHFSEDWADAGEPFLAAMAGWAVIAVPALAHSDAVAAIFTLLAGSADGAIIAYILACSAAPALLCSLVVIHNAARAGHWGLAIRLGTALGAAVILPPLLSFALYFCLFHTPQHMATAWASNAHLSRGRRLLVLTAVSGLAFGLAALLFHINGVSAAGEGVIATTFITLSVLTLPHFLMEAVLRRRAATL